MVGVTMTRYIFAALFLMFFSMAGLSTEQKVNEQWNNVDREMNTMALADCVADLFCCSSVQVTCFQYFVLCVNEEILDLYYDKDVKCAVNIGSNMVINGDKERNKLTSNDILQGLEYIAKCVDLDRENLRAQVLYQLRRIAINQMIKPYKGFQLAGNLLCAIDLFDFVAEYSEARENRTKRITETLWKVVRKQIEGIYM